MVIQKHIANAALALMLALGMAGTAAADRQGTNTAIGAGVGGVAGAVLSGDPWVTLGSAAAGGVLGYVLTGEDRDRGGDRWDRDRRGKHWDRGDRGRHYKRVHHRGHGKHSHHHRRHHR